MIDSMGNLGSIKEVVAKILNHEKPAEDIYIVALRFSRNPELKNFFGATVARCQEAFVKCMKLKRGLNPAEYLDRRCIH